MAAVRGLLAIIVLAALFIACVKTDRVAQSPLQQAARRLRPGMSFKEAMTAMDLGPDIGLPSLMGSLRHTLSTWHDEARNEKLTLDFETPLRRTGRRTARLIKWKVDPLQ